MQMMRSAIPHRGHRVRPPDFEQGSFALRGRLPSRQLPRDSPMQKDPPLTARFLPWIIAGLALVVYAVTVSHWVTIQSLTVVAQVAGWDGNLPANAPLLYLVTRPFLVLPDRFIPIAGNLFTALLAAATVWTLVRTIQLFPQDRTHPQRIRGFSDGRPLDLPLAWVPPVLAAGTFALQLTTWEHATSLSGEMFNALLFATVARCLFEYRASRNERWLDAYALLIGLGIPQNWAMLGFLPLFITAFFWIGGWEFIQLRRILRLAGIGAAGLLLYLLLPAIGAGSGGLPEGFGSALWAVVATQKDYLLNLPKSRFVMLAAVMILPLAVAGVRWTSPRGSGIERLLTFGTVTLLQFAWVGMNLWMAFDGVFSPRTLVTVAGEYGALPLLTFHICAALAVGYFAGYFIVLGSVTPDQQWSRADLARGPISKILCWLMVAAAVAMPPALAIRNWPAIQVQNGPILEELAAALVEPLPNRPAMIVSDDEVLNSLLGAQLRRMPDNPGHLVVNARRAPELAYRRNLVKIHGAQWPELAPLATARENVGGIFLHALVQSALTNLAYSVTPSTSFLTELNHLRPAGAIFAFQTYKGGEVAAPRLNDAEAAAVIETWTRMRPQLERVMTATTNHSAPAARYAASFWARSINTGGVALQRAGKLEPASQLFALAHQVDPDNVAVTVNTAVNERLRNRQAIDVAVRKPIEPYGVGIVEFYGAIDEPRFLEQFGNAVLTLGDPLVRAAANAFLRARELDPESLEAAIGYARSCLAANEPSFALAAHAEAAGLARRIPPTPAQFSHLHRVLANAHLLAGKIDEAEKVLIAALGEQSDDIPMLDQLTFLYVQSNRPEKAIPIVDRLLALKPGDDALLQRKGYLLLQSGQFAPAVAALDEVLKRRPEDRDSRINRATALMLAGQLDKAQSDFEKVLDDDSNALDAHVGLTEVALRQNRKPDAIRHIEKAISKTEPNSSAHSNLTARLGAIKAMP
jgi:tetratricopeptide (TPR) repeat protein